MMRIERAIGINRPIEEVSRDAELGVGRLLRPIFRIGIGRDIAGQLRALKRVLE